MSNSAITVHGYQFSVYTRTVKLILIEKQLTFDYIETNPFRDNQSYQKFHPFGRVPVLVHNGFTIYETAAITRYLDAAFPTPPMTPVSVEATSRMQQVISIIDSYGYRALVRQVFSNLIFRPLEGIEPSAAEVAEGLDTAQQVLAALEQIAEEGLVLTGHHPSLCDYHLIPMIDYFLLTTRGQKLFRNQPSLCKWWKQVGARRSVQLTHPDLSQLSAD